MELQLRKARFELYSSQCNEIDGRVWRALLAPHRQIIANNIEQAEGYVSRSLRDRITINQLLSYLSIHPIRVS